MLDYVHEIGSQSSLGFVVCNCKYATGFYHYHLKNVTEVHISPMLILHCRNSQTT